MSRFIEASFCLSDHLNPHFGYQVKIENGRTGDVLLHRSNHPVGLTELLTASDCIDLINWFINEGATEKDFSCALCQDTVPVGTLPAELAEYINYGADLTADSIDLAHRNCAIDSGDQRWSYDK